MYNDSRKDKHALEELIHYIIGGIVHNMEDTTIKIGIAIYMVIMLACIAISVNMHTKAKKTPAMYSLMVCQILMSLWLFLCIMENLASSVQEALLIDRIILIPISFLGGSWFIFSLYYCDLINKKNRYLILLILLPLVILYIPALTTNHFNLIIKNKVIGKDGWTEWGVFFIITDIFSYVYSFAGIIIVVIKSLKEFRYLKLHKSLVVFAALVPLIVHAVTALKIMNTPFDYTPVSFSICIAFLSIAIFKYKLFDITPLAVNNIFSNMEEAVLILNDARDIVDYNKASAEEFKDYLDIQDAKNIESFLNILLEHVDDKKQIAQLLNSARNGGFGNIDSIFFTLNKGQDDVIAPKSYCLYIKPLADDSGRKMGSIISFKNVSKFKKITLDNERNRLSGDLHDTLGNCIMAICANLKYAIEKFSDSEEVLLSIKQAHSAATGGILYLRQVVEELTPVDISKYGLIWALQSLFKKLESAGAVIDFRYSGIDEKTISKTKYANIIYKTCQEALNNSFYHGKAKDVFINLVSSSDELKLYISDDGVGCGNIVKSKGLTGIEEKVRAVGGRADFGSPSDGGFNIRIAIPYQPFAAHNKIDTAARGGYDAKSIDS